jgi:hypothetical protein
MLEGRAMLADLRWDTNRAAMSSSVAGNHVCLFKVVSLDKQAEATSIFICL